MDRIERLTGTDIEIEDAANAQESKGPGRIEVKGLTFAYPVQHDIVLANRTLDEDGKRKRSSDDQIPVETPPSLVVLQDISFVVEPGQTLGVFGPLGSGKSTLASLLTRLYEPPEGAVFVDDVDIRQLTLASLRRRIVLAPQETFLFSTTVSRNITLAQGLRGDGEFVAEVHEFAELAHLHHDVEGFSEGYGTILGERGVNLSGGQRQRLAIARAIATDPDILILDDCLSAVDATTEEAILGNLRQVFDGRSGIVISHRVRAVQDCDHILVIEDGQLTQQGTHESLLGEEGYYAQIAAEQQRAAA